MNIVTRGGIEFLAVLLGISGSLWIDNYSKEKDIFEFTISQINDYVSDK